MYEHSASERSAFDAPTPVVPPGFSRSSRERSKKCKTWDQTTWNDMGLPNLLDELDVAAALRDGFDQADQTTSSMSALAMPAESPASHPPTRHARHTSLMGLELKSQSYSDWLSDPVVDSPSYAADDLKVTVGDPSMLFGGSSASSPSSGSFYDPRPDQLLSREPVEEPDMGNSSPHDADERIPELGGESHLGNSGPDRSHYVKRRSVTFAGPLDSIAAAAAAANDAGKPMRSHDDSIFHSSENTLRKAFPPTIFDSAESSHNSSSTSSSPSHASHHHARGHQRATSESAVFLSLSSLGGNFGGLPAIPASPRLPLESKTSHESSSAASTTSSSSSSLDWDLEDKASLRRAHDKVLTKRGSSREHQTSGIESGPIDTRSSTVSPQTQAQRGHDNEASDAQSRQSNHRNSQPQQQQQQQQQQQHQYSQQQPCQHVASVAPMSGGEPQHMMGLHDPTMYSQHYDSQAYSQLNSAPTSAGMPGAFPMGMVYPGAGQYGFPMGANVPAGISMATAEQLRAIQTMQSQVMMQWMQMQEQQRLIMLEQQRIAAAAAANNLYYSAPPQHAPSPVQMSPTMMGHHMPNGGLGSPTSNSGQHQTAVPPTRSNSGAQSPTNSSGSRNSGRARGSRGGRNQSNNGGNNCNGRNPRNQGHNSNSGITSSNPAMHGHNTSTPNHQQKLGSKCSSDMMMSPESYEGSDSSSFDGKTFSTLLQQHKHAGFRPSVQELKGHVVEFACDSHGSRHIQFLNESATSEDRDILIEEATQDLQKLMKDVFANYVVQNLLVHCSGEQRLKLLAEMKGQVLALSLDQYGTRVVQRALEVASPAWRRDLVAELCTDDDLIRRTACDANATHVLQRIVDLLVRNGGDKPQRNGSGAGQSRGGGRAGGSNGSGSRRGSSPVRPRPKLDKEDEALMTRLEHAIAADTVSLSRNQHASRLVLLVLGDCDTHRSSYISTIMKSLESSYGSLVWDQHGVFAAGHVLAYGTPAQQDKLQRVVAVHVLELAKHKFGSHLVEKALKCATEAQLEALVVPILDADGAHAAQLGLKPNPPESDGSIILHLAKDPYGNFVVSKAYEVATGSLRERLFKVVNARNAVLSRFTYGRHILNHVNK